MSKRNNLVVASMLLYSMMVLPVANRIILLRSAASRAQRGGRLCRAGELSDYKSDSFNSSRLQATTVRNMPHNKNGVVKDSR